MKAIYIGVVLLLFTIVLQAQFTPIPFALPAVQHAYTEWGDYNHDGKPDFLYAGSLTDSTGITRIYVNNGTTFTPVELPVGFCRGGIQWMDFDNDTDLDIFVAGQTNSGYTTQLLRNTGNNTWQSPQLLTTDYVWITAALSEANNDGRTEALLSGATVGSYLTYIVTINPDFTCTTLNSSLPGVINGSADWCDYDGDGDNDLVLAGMNESASCITGIYRNDNYNTFTPLELNLPGICEGKVTWCDYNSDGLPDLLITGMQNGNTPLTRLYRNTGNNNFIVARTYLIPLKNSDATWLDYNNDGKPDLLLCGETASGTPVTRLYRNCGNDQFRAVRYDFPGVTEGSLSCADYDNDGDTDILLCGHNADGSMVTCLYRNDAFVRNLPPSVPTNLSYYFQGNHIVFTWDEAADDTTPSRALTYNFRMGYHYQPNYIVSSVASETGVRYLYRPGFTGRKCIYKLRYNLFDLYDEFVWSVQAIDNGGAASAFSENSDFSALKLLYPNGGEVMQAGNTMTVRWVAHPSVGQIFIKLSLDGGSSWYPLTNWVVNAATGMYNLVVPYFPTSAHCRIKISMNGESFVEDNSDSDFTIITPELAPPMPHLSLVNGSPLLTWQSVMPDREHPLLPEVYLVYASDCAGREDSFRLLGYTADNSFAIKEADARCSYRFFRLVALKLPTDDRNCLSRLKPGMTAEEVRREIGSNP